MTHTTDTLRLIEFSVNHNTYQCSATFGMAFKFDGPLMKLPDLYNGKATHVVGLTPYTVEAVTAIPYRLYKEASNICNRWHNDAFGMVAALTALTWPILENELYDFTY